MFVDYELRLQAERRGFGIKFVGEQLFNLDFVDDIALIAGSKTALTA